MLLSFLREFPWNLSLVIAISEWFRYPFASSSHLALAVPLVKPFWGAAGSSCDEYRKDSWQRMALTLSRC